MKDPLHDLALLYNDFNDTLKLKATLNKIDKITELQNTNLPDSLQYDYITFESFDENVQEESENFIYDQITHGTVGGNSTRKRKQRKSRSTRTKRGGNPLFLIAFVALSIYLCGSGDGDRDEGSAPPTEDDDDEMKFIMQNKVKFPSTKKWTPEQIAAKKAKSTARLRAARRVKFSPSTKSASQSRDMQKTRKSRRGWGGGYKK